MRIEPKLHPGGKGYMVNFRHPLLGGKSLFFGLGTTDDIIARDICRDARIIFDNPDLLQAPTPKKLVGSSYRAFSPSCTQTPTEKCPEL